MTLRRETGDLVFREDLSSGPLNARQTKTNRLRRFPKG